MMIVSATRTACDPMISVKRMTIGSTANTSVTMEAPVHVSVHVLIYQLDQVYVITIKHLSVAYNLPSYC